MHTLRLVLLFIILPITASAQFFVTGDDPGRLKWNYIDTESYRVIYPQGTDSLAKIYAVKLEKYKIPVSRTSGYITGDGDGKIMPVVIHAYNDANGSVAWAPKRMDLFTIPSAYDPEPLPWSTMLSVHESRHVSQMQFGLTEKHKPGKWFLGQGWNIIAFLLYPSLTHVEGDAVVAETALTPSGRGRTAGFLNYYWVAFDHGDFRKWFKWRFMSQLRYSPSYYALGYMTIGGYRYLYDYPHFVSDGLHMAASDPLRISCLDVIGKKISGKKWDEAWLDICDTMYGIWKRDADERAPYIPYERVLPDTERYTDYTDLMIVEDDIYAIKRGHVHTPELIRIDEDGNEHRICSFASTTSTPLLDDKHKRLYWSESIPDERWTLKSDSKIIYMDQRGLRKRSLKNSSMLYNPFHHDCKLISVRYHNEGHSSIEVIDAHNGDILENIPAPDSLQLVEVTCLNNDIYATAISENGYGIYTIDGNRWFNIITPQPVMISGFQTFEKELMFTCDRTGVNELYHLDPYSGSIVQKTSTRYGATDHQYSTDGKTLFYSSQTLMGKHIFKTPVESLLDRKVKFDSLYRYPIAEKITEQEKAEAKAEGYDTAVTLSEKNVKTSEPKRYRKVPNMLNLHTWFPAYVGVDNIMNNLSFDPLWKVISLGVSGVMQNNLATAIGEIGYSAHKDPYNTSKWRHSGHFNFTYSGLYPIFQFSLDINDRGARQLNTFAKDSDKEIYMVNSRELSSPYINGKVSMYIPFNFNSGGWNKGLIPRLTYSISNDIYDTSIYLTDLGQTGGIESFSGYIAGKKKIMQTLSGSVRGYIMRPIANSQVYPRWGLGAEVGASSGLENYNIFSPMGYIYGYGYIPGIIRTQGMKLTALWQRKLSSKAPFSQQTVDILPRGLSGNSALGSHVSLYNKNIVKLTADYAIPIYIGDITIGGNWLAIKRLVAYPHFDYTFIEKQGLWSAGLDITADLNAIVTLEWPCSVGLSFSWNGGSAWNSLTSKGISMNKWFLGPIFNVSF